MTVGDWVCACGQRYRVVVDAGTIRMWPESAAGDFREQPIDGTCVCGAPVDGERVAAAIGVYRPFRLGTPAYDRDDA